MTNGVGKSTFAEPVIVTGEKPCSEISDRVDGVSKCIFHRLALWFARQVKKIIHWVIQVLQAVGNAISTLFQRMFGTPSTAQQSSSSTTPSITTNSTHLPTNDSTRDHQLSLIATSTSLISTQVKTTSHLTFHLPDGTSYCLDNPYARGTHFGDFLLFRKNLSQVLASHRTFKLELNPQTILTLKNPFLGKQAIQYRKKAPVKTDFWETPSLTFVQKSGASTQIQNPFAKGKAPTDDEVYQFRTDLKKLFQDVYAQDAKSTNSSHSLVQVPSHASLQKQAAEHFPPKPLVDYSSSDLFPLFDSSQEKLESGRNLLLNYIQKDVAVWNQGTLSLGCAINYCIELSNLDVELTNDQKKNIRIFFDKLKAVPSEQVDISLYLGGEEKLQRILSPRLDDLLTIKEPNADQLLEINLAKAELATSFGYGIVPTDAGANGAVFIKTLENVPVGVFKAPQELSWLDFVEIAKLYVGQARLLNSEKGAQEYAEVVASDLCKEFNFNGIAPEAITASFCGKEGSFIAFKGGFQELKDVKDAFNARTDFSEDEINLWQMIVVWNSFIGNLDPHDENIFVVMGIGDVLERACMIDHGNAFPVYNPAWLGSKGNLGAWGRFTISKEPFTDKIKKFILDNLSQEKMEQFFESNKARAAFFKPKMRDLQIKRIRILRECVESGQIINPEKLAEIKTDHDYAIHLNDDATSSK